MQAPRIARLLGSAALALVAFPVAAHADPVIAPIIGSLLFSGGIGISAGTASALGGIFAGIITTAAVSPLQILRGRR